MYARARYGIGAENRLQIANMLEWKLPTDVSQIHFAMIVPISARVCCVCVCVGIIAVCYFARNQIQNRLYNQLFYLHILSVAHLHRQSLKHRRCQRRRPSWDRASETETYLRTHTPVQRKSNWKERMTHSYASTYLNQHQPKIV